MGTKKEDGKAILEEYHNALTAGHTGMAKMIQAVLKDYWWPNMNDIV